MYEKFYDIYSFKLYFNLHRQDKEDGFFQEKKNMLKLREKKWATLFNVSQFPCLNSCFILINVSKLKIPFHLMCLIVEI